MMLPASAPRSPACPSDLDLDEILAGDLAGNAKEARMRTHLTSCPRCSARLAAFSAVEPPPFSVVRARLFKESPPPRYRRRWIGATATFAAAAAGLLLTWRLGGKPAEPAGERTKGGLGLTVLVKRASGTIESVIGTGRLRAGDEMRFSLVTSKPGYAVVLGLDAAPSVTIYAPAAPAAAPVQVAGAGPAMLPGSIVADATAGMERIVALVCPSPIAPQELRGRAETALARAQGRPERVSSLDSGCLETSVLMRKEDRSP